MAHNLNTTNGKVSFANGNGQVAWHGLGQTVAGSMTAEQAIDLAGLGYKVIKENLLIEGANGFNIVVPDHFATKRNDTNEILGVVGSRYEIVQNSEAFGFFDAIVGEGANLAMYETAGALGKGEKIFITAKMPDFIRIAGTDDISEVYVLLTSAHDGSGSIIATITPIRVVCQNTLNIALGSATNKVCIRHTKNAKVALEAAHKILGISHAYVEEVSEIFNTLSLKSVTDAKVKELVENLFKSEAKDQTKIEGIRNDVMQSYFTGVGQSKIIGTAYGVINAITHYVDHVKTYKNDTSKLESIMSGESANIVNEAAKMLLAL